MDKSYLLKSEIMCPNCITPSSKNEILYYCEKCKELVNPNSNFFEKQKLILKNYLINIGEQKIMCDHCNSCDNIKIACPKCSNVAMKSFTEIPKEVLEQSYFPFSIVGVTQSGKTNYITVMLEELKRNNELGLSLIPLNKEAKALQKKHKELIYDKHTPPDPTEPGRRPDPQIWQIQNGQKRGAKIIPSLAFTIYDGAGEDSTNDDPVNKNYIKYSEAVIITIDPLTLEYVRPYIKKEDIESSERDFNAGGGRYDTAEDALKNVLEKIREKKSIKNKRLDIPIAIVFTKFDTIRKNKQLYDKLGEDPVNDDFDIKYKKVNILQIKQASNQIESFLEEVGENNFLHLVKNNFNNYMFFGVSSYGMPPKNKHTTPDQIKPYRVLAPILWLFKKKEFLD